MLDSIELRNFRAFRDGTVLPFSPLTLILGSNSAGKSSLLSALLLMKQTIEDPSFGVQIPILRLNGTRIDAGNYRDIVYSHNIKSKIGFSFHFSNNSQSVGSPLVGLRIPRMHYAPWMYRRFRNSRAESRRKLQSLKLDYSSAGQFSPNLSSFRATQADGNGAWFTRTTERERIQHWKAYTHGLPQQSLSLGFSESSPFFPDIRLRKKAWAPKDYRMLRTFMRETNASMQEVSEFLSLMTYVGPFRTPPKRRYSFSGLAASETGQSGEQAMDLLILETITRHQSSTPLRDAVAFWLRHMNLAKSVDVSSIAAGSNLFEIMLSGAGTAKSANIADVGFGISQVLPVLIQGLLTPRGGLYAVQQPELHLHPDAQAGLADFFLFLAEQGIRCMIETHSEYLLVRLRRRLAEGGHVNFSGVN
jgi:hypothetical protein